MYLVEFTSPAEDPKKPSVTDMNNLRSLSALGIDVSFLDSFEQLEQSGSQLSHTAELLQSLQTEQNERLARQCAQAALVPVQPTPNEIRIGLQYYRLQCPPELPLQHQSLASLITTPHQELPPDARPTRPRRLSSDLAQSQRTGCGNITSFFSMQSALKKGSYVAAPRSLV
ncbi:hypothetical protein FHG87_003925 [Trinorchestia longiramus]|nr:hypothetical protein FHG87_003925 [Trinorchestia longiramus]